MLQLIINGRNAVMAKDTSFTIKAENPTFSDKGEYSMEINLPLKGCKTNIEILGAPYHRKEQSFKDIIGKNFPAKLIAGKFQLAGFVSVKSADELQATVQFVSGRKYLELECKDEYGNDLMVFKLNLGRAYDTLFKTLCPNWEYNRKNLYKFFFGIGQDKYPRPSYNFYPTGDAKDWENVNTLPWSFRQTILNGTDTYSGYDGLDECALLPVHVPNSNDPEGRKDFNIRDLIVYATYDGTIKYVDYLPHSTNITFRYSGENWYPQSQMQHFLFRATAVPKIEDEADFQWRVQPKLWLIAERIMAAIGHPLKNSKTDNFIRRAFNKFIIVNPVGSEYYSALMPNWTVYRTIQEIENFCGVRFYIDSDGYGHIVRTKDYYTDVIAHRTVADIVEEHSVEIDEEAQQKDMTRANVMYNFNEGNYTEFPNGLFIKSEILKGANIQIVDDVGEIASTDKKASSIYYAKNGSSAKCWAFTNGLRNVAPLGPLVRDKSNTQDFKKLGIIPAKMTYRNVKIYGFKNLEIENGSISFFRVETEPLDVSVPMIVASGSPVPPNTGGFNTGQMLAKVDTSLPENLQVKSHNSFLEVAVIPKRIKNGVGPQYFDCYQPWGWADPNWKLGCVFPTALGMNALYFGDGVLQINRNVLRPYPSPDSYYDEETWKIAHSFSLTDSASPIYDNALDPDRSDTAANTKAEYCFKFTDDIMPEDICNVFHIRNRKFICRRIEYTITERGVAPMKTGYFYETDR